MRASEGSKVVCAVGDPVRESEGCVVGVGGKGRLVDGERGEELFFGDFVPLSTRDGLSAEVAGLASECEVDTAVPDGYGDVWGRRGVHPGLRDEGDVQCCGVQEVPEFNGVLVDGLSVDQDAFEVVDGAWAGGHGSCVVEDTFAGVAGVRSMGTFWVSLKAGVGASWVEGVEGGGVVAEQRGLGVLRTRGRGAGRGPGADGHRRACHGSNFRSL
ncbi:hypothetical protein NDU88_009351 [Pleurodeles waltl]|uniref:Uncharacterized protein n=1 Tax=Pleurodeles waltl TaxID=8319 RepID=A0AAV7S0S3_PLEWA|nr:hypothetical protein NDU88_009351 [Pleurodeles waltl]